MANTQWVITDLWNKQLFQFDTTQGFHPNNSNSTTEQTGETFNVPWDNITQKIDFGLGSRFITLQGVEIDDKDVWALTSAINYRQLMKLWVGEDFFYYVLGQEARQVRDERNPTQKSYNISFNAVDPYYYYAQSSTTIDTTERQNLVVPSVEIEDSGIIDVDLTGATASEGTTFLEPCFWIIGGAATSLTKITIQDPYGRQLEYTPTTTIATGHEHVIMPYRNTTMEGFVVNDATGFKLTANGLSETTAPTGTHNLEIAGDWQMDVFQHGAGTEDNLPAGKNVYAWITEEVPCVLTRNGVDFIEKSRNYPRCEDGQTTNLTVTYTGTSTDVAVYAQW